MVSYIPSMSSTEMSYIPSMSSTEMSYIPSMSSTEMSYIPSQVILTQHVGTQHNNITVFKIRQLWRSLWDPYVDGALRKLPRVPMRSDGH
jgi:hypothetical protein